MQGDTLGVIRAHVHMTGEQTHVCLEHRHREFGPEVEGHDHRAQMVGADPRHVTWVVTRRELEIKLSHALFRMCDPSRRSAAPGLWPWGAGGAPAPRGGTGKR